MTQNHEIEEWIQTIGEDPIVDIAFVVSSHGKVEAHYPLANEKQVAQWALVLMPLLKMFLGLKSFRFARVQYREGELWMGELSESRCLVVVVKSKVETKTLSQKISIQIQKFQASQIDGDNISLAEPIQRLLYQATDHLRQHGRSEADFFGALRKSAFLYFGALGEEWVDQSLEKLWITLPIRQRQPMEEIVAEVKKRMSHPIKRIAFEKDAAQLINKFLT